MCEKIKYFLVICILYGLSPSAFATPIVFNFTGTISDEILSYGQLSKTWKSIPKWNGKTVTGSVTLDLDGLLPEDTSADQTYYTTNSNGTNEAQWLSFIINNPDGTSYTLPDRTDVLPLPKVNGSTAYLIYDPVYNSSSLYIGRVYVGQYPKNQPRQDMFLRLGNNGDDAANLFNTTDFNTVEFDPTFATLENYGGIQYLKDNGKMMAYSFKINSLTRVKSQVPEPSILSLILIGFAGLLLNRTRRT